MNTCVKRVLVAAALLAFGAVETAAETATTVATGFSHTCALTPAGGVNCWGYNGLGQLKDGTTRSRSTAAVVEGARYHNDAMGVVWAAGGDALATRLRRVGAHLRWGSGRTSRFRRTL